jgi:hypothetical protein
MLLVQKELPNRAKQAGGSSKLLPNPIDTRDIVQQKPFQHFSISEADRIVEQTIKAGVLLSMTNKYVGGCHHASNIVDLSFFQAALSCTITTLCPCCTQCNSWRSECPHAAAGWMGCPERNIIKMPRQLPSDIAFHVHLQSCCAEVDIQ